MFVRRGLLSVSVVPSLTLGLALALGSLACSKSETAATPEGDKPAASASAVATASAAASAPASADTPAASAKVETNDATAPAPAVAVAAKEASKGGGAAPATSGSAEAAACGTKPLPDCPLQAWMKANANPAVASSDLPALATALDKMATFAPPGYTNWASISNDGAKAARAGDLSAAKASCRGCHDQYKQKYKTEMRARKI